MLSPVNVVVGKTYQVPCVRSLHRNQVYPILLPAHRDGMENCLYEVPEHYHLDFRFYPTYGANLNAIEPKFYSAPFLEKLPAINTFTESLITTGQSGFFFINRWYRQNGELKLSGKKCPHKGVQVVNACGTCPAHGLPWNLKTKSLQPFKLPFYLELANNGMPNPNNPRGVIENDSCTILHQSVHPFDHDGTVIMVDSLGRKVTQQTQKINPRKMISGNKTYFDTEKLCSREH